MEGKSAESHDSKLRFKLLTSHIGISSLLTLNIPAEADSKMCSESIEKEVCCGNGESENCEATPTFFLPSIASLFPPFPPHRDTAGDTAN
jgi:hypothetical protein